MSPVLGRRAALAAVAIALLLSGCVAPGDPPGTSHDGMLTVEGDVVEVETAYDESIRAPPRDRPVDKDVRLAEGTPAAGMHLRIVYGALEDVTYGSWTPSPGCDGVDAVTWECPEKTNDAVVVPSPMDGDGLVVHQLDETGTLRLVLPQPMRLLFDLRDALPPDGAAWLDAEPECPDEEVPWSASDVTSATDATVVEEDSVETAGPAEVTLGYFGYCDFVAE